MGASLERSSEHPLAAAAVAEANERGATLKAVTEFESLTGKGVTGKIGGQQVAVGNAKLLADARHRSADLEAHAEELRATECDGDVRRGGRSRRRPDRGR